ncbi:RNA polymerase sigma factor [Candidatus Uhrbacteria bacterium]|nr:RNA polymerase sigma factor [Candidatus Uhrbacteria bacterium]
MANLYDQYLLFRVRTKRDKEAFGKLYDRHVKAIYRFVLLKLRTKQMAEDVTSETFLRCWQYVQEHKEIGNMRAFLYKIARNLVVDVYRRSDRLEISLSTGLESNVTFIGEEPSFSIEGEIPLEMSDRSSQQRQIEASAELRLILDKISHLKEDYRDVLTLRLIDGLAFGDIAQVLEKTTGNVRVIYHRAMKALENYDTPRN